jgi:hypothetical protein
MTARITILNEIANLPPSAFLTAAEAAAFLNTTVGVLANWRSARCGPRYHGANTFIRYRLKDLDEWISQRAWEVRPAGSGAEEAQP